MWKRKPKSTTDEPGFSATGVSTSGVIGSAKSAIGFIPIVGSAINTMLDEAKKAKDNEHAKQQLIVEIKYSILLIESSKNLLNYIQTKKLMTQLCDVKIIADMNELIINITNMINDLRKDDSIKFQTNKEIEKILISEYSQHLSKDLSSEERARVVFEKQQEIASNFCERSLMDEDAIDIVERIGFAEEIYKNGIFLLNEGLGRDRMFYIKANGDKIFLKLETFLEQCGLSKFSNDMQKKFIDNLYESNVAKFLRNTEKIEKWIALNQDVLREFITFPYQGNTREETITVFILNHFLMQFMDEKTELFAKIVNTQDFLLNIDTYSFQVLMQVLNDPFYVRNTIDRWASSLQCIHKGTSVRETRFDPGELISKIVIVSDFVNFRINLNIIATQLNSLYQELLFQVLQLKTRDPAAEELLCPTFSMDMFR
jgi:hypothetical protein